MIYTVTLNPSLDYIVKVKNFQTGIVNRIEEEELLPGGKGINVSIVLKNLGIESTALGFLAGFTGIEINKKLTDLGLTTDFIPVKEGYSRINVKLKADQETEINGSGPIITQENLAQLESRLDLMKNGDTLVLAGSIPDPLSVSLYRDIMSRLQDRELKIVVDATGDLLRNVLPFHPFLIKPNNHELGALFDCEIRTKDDVTHYGRKLQEQGARNVLVSMAGDGAVLIAETGEVFQAEAPKGKVVNSVGAGDSMVAGFLTGFINTGNLKDAFYTGVCTGSASAFSQKLATADEVRQLLDRFL